MLYFSGKGCSEFPKKVLILIGILKNLSQGGFKMEIHKDFYFEAVLNDYLRKDNMDVFVTGRSS